MGRSSVSRRTFLCDSAKAAVTTVACTTPLVSTAHQGGAAQHPAVSMSRPMRLGGPVFYVVQMKPTFVFRIPVLEKSFWFHLHYIPSVAIIVSNSIVFSQIQLSG